MLRLFNFFLNLKTKNNGHHRKVSSSTTYGEIHLYKTTVPENKTLDEWVDEQPVSKTKKIVEKHWLKSLQYH